jgi:hypothetical protein
MLAKRGALSALRTKGHFSTDDFKQLFTDAILNEQYSWLIADIPVTEWRNIQ